MVISTNLGFKALSTNIHKQILQIGLYTFS